MAAGFAHPLFSWIPRELPLARSQAPETQCVRGEVFGGVLTVHHFGSSGQSDVNGQSGVKGARQGAAALRHPLALTVASLAPPADQHSHLVDLRRSALVSRILVLGGSSLLLPSVAHHRAAARPETRLTQSLWGLMRVRRLSFCTVGVVAEERHERTASWL